MKRILVIGGYGGFGTRLCRRLEGHHLLVGGRNEEKARRLCAELPSAEPVRMDRSGDVRAVIARLRPDLVIDAAGPFQGLGYGVPQAAIAAGVPYLDLADARDFVVGAASLGEQARRAGVAVVSGASSVPALSGAVARRLAEGLETVTSVDIAISASNRSSGGEAVMAAILSYVGKPLRLWRGRRWVQGYGWQEMRREHFVFADGSGAGGRLVALAEVPDLELLPMLLPGRPAVTFWAGTEFDFQMRALWLASWGARLGLAGSLAAARRGLVPMYRATRWLGGSRSAMCVTVTGRTGGRALVERRWTLVAERGDGLEVPTLAAAALAQRIMAGEVPAGVANPSAVLEMEDFEPGFAGLAIRHEIVERDLAPLYARVLGSGFERLPAAVRAIHDVAGDAGAFGEGKVVRGKGAPARLIAAFMRLPRTGTWPLHVAFAERDGVEVWTRDFGGHRFKSELSAKGRDVVERFGSLRFAFDLPAGPSGLAMRLRRWSVFGIRLPLALAPRIAAREWEEDGHFRFDVAVAVPLIGEVVHYSGWLASGAKAA